MANVNPPPIRIPPSLLQNADEAGFFQDIITTLRQLRTRTGGGSDTINNISITESGNSTSNSAAIGSLGIRASDMEARLSAVSAQQRNNVALTLASDAALLAAVVRPPRAFPDIAEGTTGIWTPTLTAVANVDALTAFPCAYLQYKDFVFFSGLLSVDATLLATVTQVGISLPIPSNFANDYECLGIANAPLINASAGIKADTTNNRINLYFVAMDTGDNEWIFSGRYQLI